CPPPHKHRTTGNKIYDWGIYTTFAWAGVAGLSLLSAHEAMHGKNPNFNWLRSLNNNVSGGLNKFLSNGPMKGLPKETIKGWADGTTMFVTLGLGGCAMMAPIKWMEDNREKNAARIDNFLGTQPPDPKTIKEEIPQTWKSVLEGRLMSWGLSYLAFCAMGPKVTGKVSKWFGDKFTRGYMHLAPHSDPKTVRKWADIGAFDATFTVITATATYLFSRSIAKRNHKHLDSEDVLMTVDPATPTPLTPVYGEPDGHEQPARRFTDTHKPAERTAGKKEGNFLQSALKSKELAEAPQIG
ncbi:MAG: hypothetical protein K2Q01_02435, partial [Rickettsiales bacterium]|nr:hypothetical protein [Rickettsiales bacterium]